MYPEVSGSGTSKNVAMLIGTPGLRLWASLVGGPIRGFCRFSANLMIVVAGSNVYTVSNTGASTLIGVVSTTNALVGMASNGTLVMCVCGLAGYTIDPIAGTVTQISNIAFTGADVVYFEDGYFVFNKPGTGRFQITQLYSTNIDSLDFATAEGAPDNLVTLVVDHREVWLFGETSTEVFYNSGNVDFPFERIQGAFIETGCAAKFSAAKTDNGVMWLAADERGQGIVMKSNGYRGDRISTHGVETAIASYSRIDDAIGYTYQQEGHVFYMLTFPTANATWCFDVTSGEWHERIYRKPSDASWNRHRSQCQIAFANEVLVGDWENGNIYVLDLDYYTDNGDALPAIRQTPHLSQGGLWQFFSRLWVDMEVGVGNVSGSGVDPQVMLQWSDDGGRTWSNEYWTSAGKLGEYRTRAIWNRLGKARDRVWRVTVTDPVKRIFINGHVDFTVGTS